MSTKKKKSTLPKTLQAVTASAGTFTPPPARARLDHRHLAEWVRDEMGGRYCWASGLGWLRWDGRRWRSTSTESVLEVVGSLLKELYVQEATLATGDPARAKQITTLLSTPTVGAVFRPLPGLMERRADEFDTHPDLLNVGNGVVDLRTGTLTPHDPDLFFTKMTEVDYVVGARHPDWTKALSALPDEVAEYMQLRFGQAATGHMTPDDAMPVLQGGGENGKSTVVQAARSALGEFAVLVPHRVLMSSPSDHPTELMTLRGARLAIIEEAPEGHHLNVTRLKQTVGTSRMNARLIRQDSVEWEASHSLMVTTNYHLQIAETDHGTWRRLLLIRFPYTFGRDRELDGGLRSRMERGDDGRAEAVLAWIIEGAARLYAGGSDGGVELLRAWPEQVRQDSQAWRASTDLVLGFLNSGRVEFLETGRVLASDLLNDFNVWAQEQGSSTWGDRLFVDRFGSHEAVTERGVIKKVLGVTKALTLPPGVPFTKSSGTAIQWVGLRFRTPKERAAGVPVLRSVPGAGSGATEDPIEDANV